MRELKVPKLTVCNQETIRELNVPTMRVCQPEMNLYILRFQRCSFSILMQVPRIASAIKNIFKIYCLMNKYQLVYSLSAEWSWG
jgi:hypothetical protein